jgi:hypothetical protein
VSTPTNPGKAAAGWYPTSPGSPELRWWDGDQWTEHFHTVGTTDPSTLRAPEGTSANTVWIWIFALLPVLQLAELPFLASLFTQVFAVSLSDPTAASRVEFAPGSGYLALQGVGFLLYGVYVVLAALDYRALNRRGVPRPFHWAWTFLSAIVYMIGRTVVVRRRTGSGMAPMWINIAALVVTFVATLIILVPVVAEAVNSAVRLAG